MPLHRAFAALGLATALYACGGGKAPDAASPDAPSDSGATSAAAATGPVTVDPHCETYCKRLQPCTGIAPIPFQDTNHEGCAKACSRGYDKPDEGNSSKNFLITRDVNCTVNPDEVDCEFIQKCHDPAGTHGVSCLKVHPGGKCKSDDDCCPDSAGNPLVCSHKGVCWPAR